MSDKEIRAIISLLLKDIEDLAIERNVYRSLVSGAPSLKMEVGDLMKSPEADLAHNEYKKYRREIQKLLQSQDIPGLFERLGAARSLLG
jgi:hypothetical protein